MYTGYFGKIKTYKKAGLIPVSICGKAPDWYTGHQYKKLGLNTNIFSIISAVKDAIAFLDYYATKKINDYLSPIFY